MERLVYVTSNPLKAERLGIHLKHPVEHRNLHLDEIQSLDVEEVVRHKATSAYAMVQQPVLVEDYSLRIYALGMLPGPLVKWFVGELKPADIARLLRNETDRRVLVQVAMAYCDGVRTEVFIGERTGTMAMTPRGREEWGTDALIIPDGWNKTWGEMQGQDLLDSSVRRLAVQKLEQFLRSPGFG